MRETNPTKLSELKNAYDVLREADFQFIKKLRRNAQQKTIPIGHSVGGDHALELAYRGSMREPGLNITGAVIIAAGISGNAYKAIQKVRAETRGQAWKELKIEWEILCARPINLTLLLCAILPNTIAG